MSNKSSRTIALAARTLPLGLVLAAAALVAGPSGGQVAPTPPPAPSAAPKSLLPDSFGPVAPAVVAPAAPLPAEAPPEAAPLAAAPPPAGSPPPATGSAAPLPAPAGPAIDLAGPLTPDLGGYGESAFTGSDGRFVDGLLRRLTTPIASRWAHIVLRRALLTRAAAPAGANPGDWIADRGRVLLGMGEVDAAKALLDNLPVDRMTPRLIRVTGQVSLAAADLPGLCPVADVGGAVSPDPVWRLAEAMCAAMAGDDISGASGFDAIRAGNKVDPFDVMLGERIATISGGGGRAANIDWDGAAAITPFRFGVAAAAGVPVPLARLNELATATGGTSWGWVLRAPAQTAEARAAALRPAVALGIASADDMVGAVAAASADLDRSALDASPAGTLRDAYAAGTTAARIAAMRIDLGKRRDRARSLCRADRNRHCRRPVAGRPRRRRRCAAADRRDARRRDRRPRERAGGRWSRRATIPPRGRRGRCSRPGPMAGSRSPPTGSRRMQRTCRRTARRCCLPRSTASASRAGRAGMPRGEACGLVPVANSWTRAIDAAGAARRTGEVAVLTATGLQTRWATVPPAHLTHIVAALIATGRSHEARMIAAEAVTRG